MKTPVVFDGDVAKRVGVIPAIVYQKINEDCNTPALIKGASPFLTLEEIKKSIKLLIKKGMVFDNGVILSTKPFEEDDILIKNKYPEEFEEIWKYYNKDKPNKGSKKKAYEKFKSSPFRKLPLFIQKAIIDKYRESVSDVRYMKQLVTFLSQEEYEEYLPKICKLTTKQGIIKGFLLDEMFYFINKQGTYSSIDLKGKVKTYKEAKILECED